MKFNRLNEMQFSHELASRNVVLLSFASNCKKLACYKLRFIECVDEFLKNGGIRPQTFKENMPCAYLHPSSNFKELESIGC